MSNSYDTNTLINRVNLLPIELIRIIKDYTLDTETHLEYMINRYRYYYNNMLTLLEEMPYQKLRTCYRMHIHRRIFQDPSLNTIERMKGIDTPDFFDILPKTVYMLSRTHMSEQPHPFYSHIRDLQFEHNEMSTQHQNCIRLARMVSRMFRVLESGNTFREKMNQRMQEIALGIFRGFILSRWIYINGIMV